MRVRATVKVCHLETKKKKKKQQTGQQRKTREGKEQNKVLKDK